jgi:hypothetical protein
VAGVGLARIAPAERERGRAAAARHVELDLAALRLVLAGGRHRLADDLRVERAGQAAVPAHDDDADPLGVLAVLEDRQVGQVLRGLGGLLGHAPDRRRVGPEVGDALLGAAQARRGDHLHRPRDLLDVLDGGDPLLDFLLGH